MDRLEFIRESGAPLEFIDEGENPILTLYETGSAASTSQYGGWWKVRWPGGVPYIKVEGTATRYVPLEAQDEPHTFALPKEVCELGNTAGLLRFYTPQGGAYTPLEPPLYVQPGSLSEKEYHELIRRIGQIAVAIESAFMAPVGTQAGLGKGQAHADARLRPALVYLDLFETLKQQWALIESQPSRTLCHEPRSVDTRRGVRLPAVARAVARQPERRAVQALMLTETPATVENEMVAYVMEKVLMDRAPAITDYLEELAASEKQWDVPADFKTKGGRATGELSERASELFVEIERAKEWASAQRRSSLLREVSSRPPRMFTARMARSAQYGPVYAAFQRYDREQIPSLRSEPHGVIKALQERAIRKSSELYELWVLFETYAQLVLSFGFRPPEGAPSLFDAARVEGGHLSVQEGAQTELHWETPSHRGRGLRIHIRLVFDQLRDAEKWPGGKLKPDLWLEVRVNDREPVCFALDAKYKRYKKCKANRLFRDSHTAKKYKGDAYFADLLYTARKKYLEALDTTAAFVIHSDPAFGGGWPVEATYWGDRQVKDLSGGKDQPGSDEFVAHRFGSIFASPGPRGSASIERLLRCLLVYHVGLNSVCWTCRSHVEPQQVDNKGALSEKGVGRAYQCCNRFWIVTHCMGSGKHRLVKYGRDSFHRVKKTGPWSCTCPVCGDRFGLKHSDRTRSQVSSVRTYSSSGIEGKLRELRKYWADGAFSHKDRTARFYRKCPSSLDSTIRIAKLAKQYRFDIHEIEFYLPRRYNPIKSTTITNDNWAEETIVELFRLSSPSRIVMSRGPVTIVHIRHKQGYTYSIESESDEIPNRSPSYVRGYRSSFSNHVRDLYGAFGRVAKRLENHSSKA